MGESVGREQVEGLGEVGDEVGFRGGWGIGFVWKNIECVE